MSYFAGFIAAVPIARKDEFVAHAERTWEFIFKPMGALAQVETWGDAVSGGHIMSFREAVQAGPDETVVFSWVEWPDKQTHDAAHARMTAPTFAAEMEALGEMPFDGKRMIYGGFTPVVKMRS